MLGFVGSVGAGADEAAGYGSDCAPAAAAAAAAASAGD